MKRVALIVAVLVVIVLFVLGAGSAAAQQSSEDVLVQQSPKDTDTTPKQDTTPGQHKKDASQRQRATNDTTSTLQADRFEPNDDFSSATRLSPGSYSNLEIMNGESDFFAVELDQGEEITSSIQFDHDDGDLDLALHDPDRNEITNSISTSDDEEASAAVPEAGTYFVEVYGFAGAGAPYSLEIDVAAPPHNDRFEPNDDFSNATSLSPGSYSNLQIVVGESDFFAVDLDRGDKINTSIQFSDSTGDLDLTLYDPSQEEIAASASFSDDERVSVVARQSGTYYVEAFGLSTESAPYSLEIGVEPTSILERGEWRFSTDGTVTSSPTVVDNTVYAGAGEDLYAVDASDGTKIWNFSTAGLVGSSPTVVGGTAYIGSNDGSLYAVDATDGTEVWSFSTGGTVWSSPTVFGGTVYVGSDDGSLYAVDATAGTEVWSFSTGGGVISSPTVAGDTVYAGSDDGSLYAVDVLDGTEVWNFSTGGPFTVSEDIRTSPTVAGDTVYIGSFDGNLYAVDASDGTELWNFSTDEFIGSSPTVAEGTVYVGSGDGSLYAVNAVDGTERWSFPTRDVVASSPTVAEGTAYVGSFDSHLYAISTDHSESSEDSRVLLGTLGHTDSFADLGPTQPGRGASSVLVSASGDTASPGGSATVTVDAQGVTSVAIDDIPDNWTVASSDTDGGQLIGDPSTGIVVSYAAAGEQSRISISVTFDIPSDAPTEDSELTVVASGRSGPDATDTATVSVQDCPVEPVVCNYDPNGNIDAAGLQQAINDFVQGNVDAGDLQTVINAFIQSG